MEIGLNTTLGGPGTTYHRSDQASRLVVGYVGSSDPTIYSLESFFSALEDEFLLANIDLHRLERLRDVRLRGTSPGDISELITRFNDLSTATVESDRGLVMTFMGAISPHTQQYNKLFSENPGTLSEAKNVRDWLTGRSMKTRTTTPCSSTVTQARCQSR
ncbi:hypothetical protein V1514DRAFT_340158 [Lipomyces japonicus]|uniref:uncharacterized protein n=1 Tax=Lipomyces japonicus TaxID=56871 RepID=UPI0034CFD7A6